MVMPHEWYCYCRHSVCSAAFKQIRAGLWLSAKVVTAAGM